MSDRSVSGDAPAGGVAGVTDDPSMPSTGGWPPGLWRRIWSGEDQLAFGAVVVVVALAAGLGWFWAGARNATVPPASAATGFPPAGEGPAATGESRAAGPAAPDLGLSGSTGSDLAVHVAGAVARPGLYHLPPGSRVADAVGRAGGKLPGADLDRLNLAARLADGQKVLVYRRGEPARPDAGVGAGGPGAGAVEVTPAQPVDLNTAGVAALDALPGVGPATARAIVEERTRRGGFRSTRDLLRVPGIGEGRFARLKDLVRV